MAAKAKDRVSSALSALTKRHPEIEQGVACAGTALESRTLRVRGKAFAFLRGGSILLKLSASLPAARALAVKSPERCRAGNTGWVNLEFPTTEAPSLARLLSWLEESYQLFAAGPAAGKAPRAAARAKTAPKKATGKTAKKSAKRAAKRPARRRSS